MKKRNYWPLLFIGIFSFTFSMIIWTIMSATKVPVHEDETFFMKYHDLKENYNSVVESNQIFNSKYDFKIDINNNELPLIIKDMFLGQRVIEEKSQHKDIFVNGKNIISITIKDKTAKKIIEASDISFRVSRPTNHNHTMDFLNKDFKVENGKNILELDLPLKGNWNITATFKVNDDIGYLYIKSNAI